MFTNTFRPCHLDLSKTPTPPHHQARPQKIITNPKNLLPKTLSPTKPCPKETDPISKYPQSCLRLSSIKNHSVAKSKLEKKRRRRRSKNPPKLSQNGVKSYHWQLNYFTKVSSTSPLAAPKSMPSS